MIDRYGFTSQDKIAQAGESLTGTYSLATLFTALFIGATYVNCSIQLLENKVYRAYYQFGEHACTILFVTPIFFHYVIRLYTEHPQVAAKIVLRLVLSCGEALNPDLAKKAEMVTKIPIVNVFGASELGGFIGGSIGSNKYGCIGKPMICMQVAVLGENGEELGNNQEGLLAAKSTYGVTYWNNPQAQAKYLVNGWNVPGDYVTRDNDGDYWFIGRRDFMIKRYSEIVPIPVVESFLAQCPQVNNGIIIGVSTSFCTEIKAIIVPNDSTISESQKATIAAIKAYLKPLLPVHHRPAYYQFVETIPLTMRGKVDRKALIEQYGHMSSEEYDKIKQI